MPIEKSMESSKIFLVSFFIAFALFFSFEVSGVVIPVGNNSVMHCPAFDTGSLCTCNAENFEIYTCDNSRNSSVENSITIDSCQDGEYLQKINGTTIEETFANFYELVRDIEVEDLNTTNEGNVSDYFRRAKDYIQIKPELLCAIDGDAFSILYKNSTGTSSSDWQLLLNGTCVGYPNNYSAFSAIITNISVVKQIDDVVGNHTVRVIVGYDQPTPSAYCGSNLTNSFGYHDTDDIIIEVVEKLDAAPPQISIVAPASEEKIEFEDNISVLLIANITDATSVSFVNISLVHNNVSTALNYTVNGTLYYANITNISSLGPYEIIFWANDTIPTNASLGTKNHVNNYTSSIFYLKNDVYITIYSPVFDSVYPYQSVLLDFLIKDTNIPYNEVYYELNGAKNVLNDSKYIQTGEGISYFLNNSASNLSQSFVLQNSTGIIHLAVQVKRFGSNASNSTILLINDSAGPFGEVLAEATISGIDNSSLVWEKVVLNTTVNITGGTKYWVKILAENTTGYIFWSYNNTYAAGEAFENASIDYSLRIFDAYSYNDTLASAEGVNTLRICENNTIPSLACAYTQYKSDTTNPYFELPLQYTSQVQLGSLQTITADVKDTVSQSIGTAILVFHYNNTNYTMSKAPISGGARCTYSLNLTPGSYNFSVFANDSFGFSNQTAAYSFTVNDTAAPVLSGIEIYPNTSDAIDPNISLFFNISLFDYSNIALVYLQYRPNTTSLWANASAVLSGNKYSANFTPAEETRHYYRVYAKDSFGNELYSTNYTVDVLYERYWSYSPLVYNSALVGAVETLNLYNVTIANLGDVDIPFEIRNLSSFPMVFSNITFNLSKDTNATIQINITTPAVDGDYPSKAIITCLSACQTKNATIGNNIIVGSVGPYLDLKIYRKIEEGEVLSTLYNLRFNDATYTTPHEMIARVKNVAAYDADNITFSFTFPDNATGWAAEIVNPANLTANFSLQRKNYDDTRDVSIRFTIDRETNRAVIYNLTINATLIYNGSARNFSNTVQINVTNIEEQYSPQIIITPPSQEGGTTPPPKVKGSSNTLQSAGLGAGTTLTYNLSVLLEPNIDVMRGANKTIEVIVANPYKNKYFSNISISFFGYYQNHIFYSPKTIDRITFNDTKKISITFYAPSYLGYSVNKMEMKFDYLVVSVGQNYTAGEKMSSSVPFNLVINEVSRNESLLCLEESILTIKNATGLGYSTDMLNERLAAQKNAVFSMDFTLAKKICDEIGESFEKIVGYDKSLNELGLMINQSEKEGYSLEEVTRLYQIANEMFASGDLANLDEAIKDAQSAYALQIKIEDASIFKRFTKFVANHLLELMAFLASAGVASFFFYKKISKAMVQKKVQDLLEEKKEIEMKISELQKKYYDEKSVSPEYFSIHVAKNQDRVAEINERILQYNAMSFTSERGAKNHVDALAEKEEKLKSSIVALQKSYYLDKTIDKKTFEKSLDSYSKSLSQVKKEELLANGKEKLHKIAPEKDSIPASKIPSHEGHKS